MRTGAPDNVYGARFLAPLLIGPVLNPINTTMVSVALVPISRSLDISSSTVLWLVAGLYLASAIAQPTLGRVGDVLGPRRVYLAGLVVVGVAGVLPSLFDGFTVVVVARVLIGIGTSAAYPSVMSLLRRRSEDAGVETPPAVISAVSILSLTTAAVGPVLGGALIGMFGWRSIFLVNVPLAVLALTLTLAWVPESRPREGARLRDLDPVGILLFACAVTSLLVFAMNLEAPRWWLLILGAFALAAMVLWELRRPNPFIDIRMLRSNGGLTRTYVRMLLIYLGLYSMVYGYSQWIQDDAGYTAAQAGYLQLPTAVLGGVMSVVIARTTRVRLPILIACLAAVVGGLLLTVLHSASPLIVLLLVAACFGVTQGLASVANQQALYRQSPPDQAGTAAGLSRTFVYLGAIASSGVIGALFGEAPTDANIHLLGLLVAVCAALAGLLAAGDKTLRTPRAGRT